VAVLRKIRTFRALPAALRRRTAAACAALALVTCGLRTCGFARLHRWLARTSEGRRLPAGEALPAARIDARALGLAARNLPLRALCLERSLALWWLARRRGADAALRIGVRRTGGGIEAHAWVEVGGVVVGDEPDVASRYLPFDGDVSAILAAIRGPRRRRFRT